MSVAVDRIGSWRVVAVPAYLAFIELQRLDFEASGFGHESDFLTLSRKRVPAVERVFF